MQDNGITYDDPRGKVELINKAFGSVFTHGDVSSVPILSGTNYPDMPPIQINSEGYSISC